MSKKLYDIEVYRNFFCVGIKDFDTKEIIFLEISEEKNDFEEIYKWFNSYDGFLISFNGIHYDNMVVKYLLNNYNKFKNLNWANICLELKFFSDKVIFGDFDDEIKRIKYYKTKWIDIDLFLYWSKMLRISKKISLKALGIQLGYHTVQELPYKPDTILTKEDLPKLRYYNYTHDLGILELLLQEMNNDVIQRNDAIVKYNFGKECFSWDKVKLGLNILLKEYCSSKKVNYFSIKDLRTPIPREGIKINDLILDKIQFTPTEEKIELKKDDKGKWYYLCNSFYTLLNHLKTRTVHSTTELSYTVIYNNIKYDIKSGGLHSWHENDIVEPNLTEVIYRDIDVASYYPSLGSEYEFVPKHLPGMGEVIKNIKIQRVKYKNEGKKKDAELYKLALNGGYYGNLNSEYTPMYDPKALLSVTINGQLYLLMLSQWLEEAGIKVDMVNTDGVTCIIPIEKEKLFKDIYHKWEELTGMVLEEANYSKVVRKNINNYLAASPDGKIKRKGLFKLTIDEKGEREIPLGDSVDENIISKALNLYFTKDIEPEEVIKNPDKYNISIYDYCKSNKISKNYTVYWNGEIQQNLNRYYFSKNQPYLFKRKNNQGTFQHVNVGQGIILFNDFVEKKWEDYNIDYQYYISKVNTIINELRNNNQLTLF